MIILIRHMKLCLLGLLFFLVGSMELAAVEPMELQRGWNIYIQQGKTLEALALFKKAYEQQPDNMQVASSYSQLLIQLGRYKKVAEVLTRAFEECPWDKWCEPALADLESVVDYLPATDRLLSVLNKRLENKDISWFEQNLLNHFKIKILLAGQKLAEAEAVSMQKQAVQEWMFLGPFNNRNQQEFLKTNEMEGDIAAVDLEKTWPGRGRVVSWQRGVAPVGGVFNLGMAMYPGDESLGYALCYVKSEEKCQAVFAVEQSGASAMWLNGELKYVDSVYVQCDSALQRIIEVDLEEGVNQVVFKLAAGKDVLPTLCLQVVYGNTALLAQPGSAEYVAKNSTKLSVGVSAELSREYHSSGNIIAGAGTMPVVEQGDSWGTSGALWGALSEFEDMVSNKDELQDYDYALALMNIGYLINHYGDDSSERGRERKYDMKLVALYPECPLFLNSAAYVQQGDNTRKELLERAVKVSPMEISAREGLMHLELKGGFYAKARRSLEKIAHDSGWSFNTYTALARIAQKDGWIAEAGNYYKHALEYASGQGWVYASLAGTTESVRKAIDILEKGSRRVFDSELAEALGGWYYKAGDYAQAREIYAHLIQLEKYSEDYWDAYAACSVALGDYNQAITRLREGLRWMPQSPFLRDKIGRLLLRIGEKEAGLKYLREALALQEDNPDLTAYIEELSSNDDTFYVEDMIDFALLEGKDITPEEYPQFDRVCLLDQNYVAVTPNGAKRCMVRKVVKVLRDSAIKDVSVEGVLYDSNRQKVDIKHARVIQPDGTVNEHPVIEDGVYNTGFDTGGIYNSAQVKSIKFSNVKEGSIIDFMYTLEDTGANVYHDEFSDIQYLGGVEPTLKLIYTAEVPESMGAESYVHGMKQDIIKKSTKNEMSKTRIELDRIPGIETEPMMPPLEEIIPFVAVSTFKSWEDLARWADGLFEPSIILPEDIKQFVHSLVRDDMTRKEKIAAIYKYVTENIRYVSISYGRFGYVPHKAERTFRSGYGDCKDTAVLLCAMLREVGVEAYPTLVRTRNLGSMLSELASPELFNHSIAYVPAEDSVQEHYWLDGTTDYYMLGMIPEMDRGTESLIINNDGGLLSIDRLEPEQMKQKSEIHMVLQSDGSGSITGREVYSGRSYANICRSFEKPESFFSMLRGFFNKRFAGVTINNLDYKLSQDEPEGWFGYDISSSRIALADTGDLKFMPWVFPTNIGGIAVLKDRNYDLMIGSPQIFEIVADIKLDDGLTLVAELPEVVEDIGIVSYKREFAKTLDGIRVVSRITLKKSRVAAAEYPEFKSFVNMIMARTREWIFVSK